MPTFVRAAPNVQQLVFSGELRFRNEYSVTDNQTGPTSTQADANRFHFRLFADYKLDDNLFAGAAVQTALASDSGNTTVSEGFDNYSLYLWRFFVGWHSKDDAYKFIAGKQPNPFYEETEMLWDADISPYGLTEQIKLTVNPQLDFTLIGGQFFFNDNPENAFYNGNGTAAEGTKVPGGDNNQDAYLAYQQLVGSFKVSNGPVVHGRGRLPILPRTRRHRLADDGDDQRGGHPDLGGQPILGQRRGRVAARAQQHGPKRQRADEFGRLQLGQFRASHFHRHVRRRHEALPRRPAQAQGLRPVGV